MASAAVHSEIESQKLDAAGRLRVVIVGGGIGGLALATFLASNNSQNSALDVSLYEAAPSLTELGAGVGVWLRTWRILSSYTFTDAVSEAEIEGLAKELMKAAPEGRDMTDAPQKAFEFRKGDQEEGTSFHAMTVPFGVLTLHRAEFQQALAKHAIPNTRTHFNKRLASYGYECAEDDSDVILKFEDGSEAHADVVIGADGIRSSTRKFLLSQREETATLIEPIWSGTLAYRCLIPAEKLEARHPTHRASLGPVVYFGQSKHVIAFPISTVSGKMINIVAFISDPSKENTKLEGAWVRPAEDVELLSTFRGWEKEVLSLMEVVERPMLWAIHTIKPLPSFTDSKGRVTLLGDAAHAMTPHQGAGGGQAIEDAHVLAALLSHPRLNKANVADALRAYDAVRVPVAHEVMNKSRLTGMLYEFNGPPSSPKAANAHTIHQRVDSGFAEVLSPKVADEVDCGSSDDHGLDQLKDHARRIMDIHDWEWTNVEAGVRQAEEAVKLFEGAIRSREVKAKDFVDANQSRVVEGLEAHEDRSKDEHGNGTQSKRWSFVRFIHDILRRFNLGK